MSHLSNVTGGSGTNKNRRMRYTLSVFTLFFLMKSRSHSNTHTQSADAMKNRINWIERIMFVVKFESHVKFNWERSSSQSCWVYCIGSTVDYHFIVSFRINTSIPSMFSHFALVSMLQLTLWVCVCVHYINIRCTEILKNVSYQLTLEKVTWRHKHTVQNNALMLFAPWKRVKNKFSCDIFNRLMDYVNMWCIHL